MRTTLIKMIRGTPLESLAYELDERLWFWKGLRAGTFSQHGEDRMILDYFGGRSGVYVDVGANYPIKISNTYLLYRHGWHGLTVEPIQRLSHRHRRFRPRDIHVNAAVSPERGEITLYEMNTSGLSTVDPHQMQEAVKTGGQIKREYKVPVWPLAELIDRHLPGQEVDFLSVDTEGYDLTVLQSADWERFRPRLIIYEVTGDNGGPVSEFVQSKGYRPLREVGCNVIMERTD